MDVTRSYQSFSKFLKTVITRYENDNLTAQELLEFKNQLFTWEEKYATSNGIKARFGLCQAIETTID